MNTDLLVNGNRYGSKLPIPYWFALLFLSIGLLGSRGEPLHAQSGSGFTTPEPGDTLSGVVIVNGTAVHPDFLRYELAFLEEAALGRGWIVFAEGSAPVNDNTLAVWDTAVGQGISAPVFPDGRYQLRLRVVKTDYNYDEYFLTDLLIINSGPTPSPTPDETALAATGAANLLQPTLPAAGGQNSFQQPTPLPSLTPFPTPTALATAARPTAVGGPADSMDEDSGLLQDLAAVETARVSAGFWQGVRLTAAIFGAFFAYLLLRMLLRRLWRVVWQQREA